MNSTIFNQINIHGYKYIFINSDWILTFNNSNGQNYQHEFFLINIHDNRTYDLSNHIPLTFRYGAIFTLHVDKSMALPQPSQPSQSVQKRFLIKINENILTTICIDHDKGTEIHNHPNIVERNVEIIISKYKMKNSLKKIEKQTIMIYDVYGHDVRGHLDIYPSVNPDIIIIRYGGRSIGTLKEFPKIKCRIIIFNMIEMNYKNYDFYQLESQSPKQYLMNGTTSRSLNKYYTDSHIILINLPNDKCIFVDITTMKEYNFIGTAKIVYNPIHKNYEYMLFADNTVKLLKLNDIHKSKHGNIYFESNIKNDDTFIIKAYTTNKLETYIAEINFKSHSFITNINLLHIIIDDVFNHRNNELSYTYEINDDILELYIEFSNTYIKDVLHYELKREKYDRLELLEKKVDYLCEQLS